MGHFAAFCARVFTKSGAGTLTFDKSTAGAAVTNPERTVTVNGGRLYFSSNQTQTFGDSLGTTAIQVASGGTLGGTGTLTITAGDHVVVASGGTLAAGTIGSANRTIYSLGSGSTLDLTSISAGALVFELGSSATAGTTYDQIQTTGSGSLNIGSGVLNFNRFSFTVLSGFEAGTYTLFNNANAITGTLGSSLTGTVGGLDATLSLSGNNIILTTVPEPSTWALLGIGSFVLAIHLRRNLRRSR